MRRSRRSTLDNRKKQLALKPKQPRKLSRQLPQLLQSMAPAHTTLNTPLVLLEPPPEPLLVLEPLAPKRPISQLQLLLQSMAPAHTPLNILLEPPEPLLERELELLLKQRQ